jgi:LacI family transcriptional regulator
VSVDPHGDNPNPFVQGANYQGATEAMEYLLRLGHRRIGFITGRPEIGSGARRLKAYRDALTKAGIDQDDRLVAFGDFSTETGRRRALELLALEDRPTAIFASNDQSAIGVFQAVEEMGLRVPDDCSVVGFDNIPEAKYLGLTTVDQFLAEMGASPSDARPADRPRASGRRGSQDPDGAGGAHFVDPGRAELGNVIRRTAASPTKPTRDARGKSDR